LHFFSSILSRAIKLTHTQDKIKEGLGMPQNKQKLKAPGISILKDQNSLAYYNMRSGTSVSLGVKERGGRKK
jgi:splicing factor 3A subunit 1